MSDTKMETMDDYKEELEASFKKIKEGDILTGTVIAISEKHVTLDLKYYTEGIISVENLSNDPEPSWSFREDPVWMLLHGRRTPFRSADN